jgi:hypothetical protein
MIITCEYRHLVARAKERGYSVAEVSGCIVARPDPMSVTVDTEHSAYPARPKSPPHQPTATPSRPAPPRGAGTALKRGLRMIGIKASPTCSCNARARTMDEKGLQWCRDNVDLIAGQWLAEEAAKRKLPYSVAAGKKLVEISIWRASKWPEARP